MFLLYEFSKALSMLQARGKKTPAPLGLVAEAEKCRRQSNAKERKIARGYCRKTSFQPGSGWKRYSAVRVALQVPLISWLAS
jgi:hypothetical protein